MAAEEIKAILHGRDAAEQQRILRWVSESIGISATVFHSPSVSATAESIPPPAVSQSGSPASDTTTRRKDIKTFVNEKSPKSDVQFAAVTAYFYAFEASSAERKDVIIPKDLQEAGRQARGFGFKNAQQTLANAVSLGYFDRAGRGEFRLNAVGENLVAMALPGTGAPALKAAKPKPSRAVTKSKAKPKAKTKKAS